MRLASCYSYFWSSRSSWSGLSALNIMFMPSLHAFVNYTPIILVILHLFFESMQIEIVPYVLIVNLGIWWAFYELPQRRIRAPRGHRTTRSILSPTPHCHHHSLRRPHCSFRVAKNYSSIINNHKLMHSCRHEAPPRVPLIQDTLGERWLTSKVG